MFESEGVKRRLVVAIGAVLEVLRVIPGTEQIVSLLDVVNGSLGGAALAHAGAQKTLSQEKLAGAVSLIYLLIFVSNYYPPLIAVQPALYKAAAALTAARIARCV